MNYLQMKLSELKKLAEDRSREEKVPFKKTVHGKNKTELIKFIESLDKTVLVSPSMPLSPINTDPELLRCSKKELVEKARSLNGFKKSWENKTKNFLMEWIIKNRSTTLTTSDPDLEIETGRISPIHFEDFLYQPDPLKVEEAIKRCFSNKPFDDSHYKDIMQ